MVWLLSIVLGGAAVVNVATLTAATSGLLGPAYRSAVAPLTSFDLATLYVLFAVQLTSMVFLFRLRDRAVSWFGAYVGLASLAAFGYTLAGEQPPFFNEIVAVAGLLVALGVFAYMRQLRQQHVLT
ncbi:MAG TPA: hypothetical protein VFJ95_02300 [Gammaproteobacteria bacterium]|jgi:hypothetical protein|nr:hypothetical protein [Gammaproteobacteria bacterium]